MRNICEVSKRARELAQQYWGMKFELPVVENRRLTRALGRMCFIRNRNTGEIVPTRLEIASRMFGNYKPETIESVLKHELCHWALAVQGKPFEDGHPIFERELRRIGAHSTDTIETAGMVYTVICTKCGKVIAKDNSQGRLKKYVTGTKRRSYYTTCCRAKITWGEMQYIEDNNTVTNNTPTIKKPEQPQKEAAALQTTTEKPEVTYNINEILIPGPKGVTNKQMIPAIQKALELHSKELVLQLQKEYPEVFESSKKYLNKKYQSLYQVVMS